MLLELEDVVSGYGDAIIVHGVDMGVDDGEMVTVIGPNGAGKSTLLKTIVGVVEAREGTITFDGDDIAGKPPEEVVEHGICYVRQDDNIFPNLSVMENLKMGAWPAEGEDWFDFDERLEEVYEQFPVLEDRADQQAGSLSGGQQQMVAMGTAMILDPDLLVLDEPSAGLAPQLVEEVFEKIVDINDAGTTVLMVEQNARAALKRSDRGIVLDMGENRFEGTGEELLGSEEVAELYLGTD
ncbi:ABC transporter ATP-binding protein [Haloplanus halobius]|uniref:ABC transporter ATP-binding protein n=1 Tax=Haloplanus halobius TaxID=2934938 RepID=UPI00200D86D7|nr:ABC transporter ATP-binding protein [Haloplanus sp. XH21]